MLSTNSLIYTTIQKSGVGIDWLIYDHQGCIFKNQIYSKNSNIVKYYYNLIFFL